MKMDVNEELLSLLKEIVSENKSKSEWAELESDDMFQSENYCGGYDATEEEFTFSYYDTENREWWFQISLDEIKDILDGRIKFISTRAGNGEFVGG